MLHILFYGASFDQLIPSFTAQLKQLAGWPQVSRIYCCLPGTEGKIIFPQKLARGFKVIFLSMRGQTGRKKISAADPRLLQKFLLRALRLSRNRYVIVIIAGHSVGLAGVLADRANDRAEIMPLHVLARVLRIATARSGKIIDLMIFDTCAINYVEVLCELGRWPQPPVKNVILSVQEESRGMDYKDPRNIWAEHPFYYLNYRLIKKCVATAKLLVQMVKTRDTDFMVLQKKWQGGYHDDPCFLIWENLRSILRALRGRRINYRWFNRRCPGNVVKKNSSLLAYYWPFDEVRFKAIIPFYARLYFPRNTGWFNLFAAQFSRQVYEFLRKAGYDYRLTAAPFPWELVEIH